MIDDEFNEDGIKFVTREEWAQHLRGRDWMDFTVVNQISDAYYIGDRTGSEAMVAIWKDISDGKLPAMCEGLGIPTPDGFIHALNVLGKHYVIDNLLEKPQGPEKWKATKRPD